MKKGTGYFFINKSWLKKVACPLFFFLSIQTMSAQTNQDLLDSVGTQPPTFELKKVDEIYIPLQNGIPYPSWELQDREYITLNGVWKSERQNVNHKLTLTKRTEGIIKLIEEEGEGRHSI